MGGEGALPCAPRWVSGAAEQWMSANAASQMAFLVFNTAAAARAAGAGFSRSCCQLLLSGSLLHGRLRGSYLMHTHTQGATRSWTHKGVQLVPTCACTLCTGTSRPCHPAALLLHCKPAKTRERWAPLVAWVRTTWMPCCGEPLVVAGHGFPCNRCTSVDGTTCYDAEGPVQ